MSSARSQQRPARIGRGRGPVTVRAWAPAVAVAAALTALPFLTSANADPSVPAGAPYTWTLIVLIALGAGAVAMVVAVGARGRRWGAVTIGLFGAFAALGAASIAWSAQPDWSWYGANQLVAYCAVFTGAAALARIAPERWPAMIGGIAAAAGALCAWSLLVKVFPAALDPTNTLGRLQAPFGYWNAIGVVGALGAPACLWAGTRPGTSRLTRGACAPAITVQIAVVVLSYSRSAVLALLIGCGLWLAFAPRRLHSIALLAVGAAGAIPVVEWMLHRPALNGDAVAIAVQDQAGHGFGEVILACVIVVAVAGVLLARGADRISLPAQLRRRIGTVLLGVAALVPVAGILALAMSSRGLTGEISHAWSSLTSVSAVVKDNSSRLSALGSSRPLYWGQALSVGTHHLLAGAGELAYGIARLRYTTASYAKTIYAHGYVFQTFADLGILGLALTAALLIAWIGAAARTLGAARPRRRRPASGTPDDQLTGLIAVGAIVTAFGAQSLLDWTWFFPGVTVPVLLGAGWLAGRGPLAARIGPDPARAPLRERPAAGAALLGVLAVALALGWVVWEPLHSAEQIADAQGATSNPVAFAAARGAAAADPLSTAPQLQLSILYQGLHDASAARQELVDATRGQPDNPEPWVWLGEFDVAHGHAGEALTAAARILQLDHAVVPRPDATVAAAQAITTQAQALLAAETTARARARTRARIRAQRRARASSRRRHSGGPPAARTSTSAN